ncbi:DUF1572 domain-containing protein [Lutimonas sp.]|jgi:uncharacterized damage-inducible protein DinB|uniref:DUF1572 domain-containing protein n=1 Tax=Lutimonas sp. TaxID=1872403 RepID=UPI003C76A45D
MLSVQIARHIRELHFGENWTDVSLKTLVEDLNWKEANVKVYDFNTIASLVFHINYYINAVLKVLQNEPLDARDQYSFNLPPINSKKDWDLLLSKTWKEAEEFAKLIEKLSDQELWTIMLDEKYGSYFRNFQGIIEHSHYHMGQIALIKKIIREKLL